MSEPATPITIDLRIPGRWSHPKELVGLLPAGCRLTPETLTLPDGSQVEFGAVKADTRFAEIFRSSCRRPVAEDELDAVRAYSMNVLLSGPGGSLEAARTMMRAAASVIHAGGAGVFIDNSALAHGGRRWQELTEDGGPDALSYAFVGIVAGKEDVWTMGMHVLGLRDVVMKRVDADDFDIIEVIRYLARNEQPIEDGHLIADLSGPRFRVDILDSDEKDVPSPMHNPFGRLKLVSMRDIAERN